MIHDNILNLVGRIYGSVQDQVAWDGVLHELLELTNSRFVMVSAVDMRTHEYSSSRFHGADDGRFLDGIADYKSELFKDDPTLKFGIQNPDAGSACLHRLVNDGVPQRTDLTFSHWARSELGVGNICVIYTPPSDQLMLGVSLGTRRDRTVHTRRELQLFSLLFRHIENALRMAARPPLVDGAEAVLLVDCRGRLCQASASARAILAAGDGLSLVNGSLRTALRADQARLDALLTSALRVMEGQAGGSTAIARPSEARPLYLTIRPMPSTAASLNGFGPVACVRIIDPQDKMGADPNWAALFGFTPAETRAAAALLNEEKSLRQAAGKLSIAYPTARVHLASIFAKTSTRTQAQLLRLLTRLAR